MSQQYLKIDELEIKLIEEEDKNELINIYVELAELLESSDRDKSMSYAKLALETSQEIASDFGKISAHLQIASIELNARNITQALESAYKALELSEASADNMNIAHCYIMIGKIHQDNGNFNEAISYFGKTELLGEKTHNLIIKAIASAALGEINFVKGTDYLALQYYIQAASFIESTNEEEIKADIYSELGINYKLLNQPEPALQYMRDALTIYESLDNKPKQVVLCYEIGELFQQLRQYDESLIYMKNCMSMAEEELMKPYITMSYEKLTDVYEKNGDFKNAYDLLKYYFAIAGTGEMTVLENKLETQQLEQKIAILNEREKAQKIEIESRNFIIYTALGGAAIVLILTGFLFFAFRQKSQINVQLQDANEQTLKSQKEKEEFFAYTSHEIRTPLNAVVGMAQLLSETDLNTGQQKYLRTITSSAKNILFLVNDVLDLSKIESGSISFESVDFSVKEIIDEVIHTLTFKVREKDVQLIADVDPNVPEVIKGDPVRINQIILNLADNALKFTSTGEVRITMKCEEVTDENVKIYFEVKDTGIGIKKSKLEQIFDSYKQESSHTTRQYGGTGLGLAITKELIQLMGSQIKCESVYGEGSRFYFTLEFKKSKDDKLRVSINEDKHIKLTDLKILVVDDNALNREIFFDLINDYKNNVVVEMAHDGSEAVEMVDQNEYDVVLMDIQMPIMDGFEATKTIRTKLGDNKKNIPVIAMTAHVLEGVASKCDAAGMNDYVAKPINLRILTQKIRQHVEIKESPDVTENNENESNNAGFDTKHVHLDELISLVGGKMEKVSKYIDIFLRNVPGDFEALKEALDKKDFSEVGGLAHKLKGNVGYMGIDSIKQDLLDLEKLKSEVGDIDEITDIVDRVEVVIELSITELNDIKTKLKETT